MAKKAKLSSGEKEQVEKLQAKKKDILEMLSRLEEKKGATRAQIYKKVKADYAERLSSVEEELKGKEEAIRKELERIAAEKQELAAKIGVLREELEEIALRHDTGEYTDKVFSKREGEKRAELEPLEANLSELEEEEAPFKELVTIEEPPKVEEPVPAEELSEEILAPEEPAKVEEPVPAEEVSEEILAPEEPAKVEEPVPAEEVIQDLSAEEAALKESERELEELIKELEDSGVDVADGEKSSEIDEEAPEELGSEGVEEKEGDFLSEEEIFKEEEKDLDELLGDKEEAEVAKPKEKGLVCKKCGTANKPDSWYCEKCGAELIEGEA